MSTHRVGWLTAAALLAAAVVVLAFVAGSSAGAFAGLATIIGGAAIVAVLVIASDSARMLSAIRRWRRTSHGRPRGQSHAVVRALASSGSGFVPMLPLPPVPPATDEELCQAWCASSRALQAAPSGRKLIELVEDRGRCLDELERRHPAAFRAWLTSDATASGSPLPYLSPTNTDVRAIDWDELGRGQDW